MQNFQTGARRTSLACGLAILGALALGHAAPAVAGDTELGTYFQNLRTTPMRHYTAPRMAPARIATVQPRRNVQPAAYTTGTFDVATLERTVFNRINIYRMSKGMRPLAEYGELASVARNHATTVAAGTGQFNHSGMRDRLLPFMGGYGSRAGGEILAFNRGAGDPARTAMHSWINSPTHKDVMESDYTRMGVGVAVAADGRHYFTVLFLR